MKIGILGSGLMGGTLGRLWAACGHEVTFAYSRDDARRERMARDAGAKSASVADAADGADAVLLAVHWSRTSDVLEQAGDLAGMTVLNCCVPLDEANENIVVGMTTSGAEELARSRPDAHWVSCFSTTPSESFDPVFRRKGQTPPPQVLTYGDHARAKSVAGDLIRDIGFEPLDCGGLRNARFIEPFAMATVELAYVQPGGPALTYRFDKLR